MRASGLWRWSALRLDVVAGLVDGILTALTLGAAHLLPGAPPMTFGLALRVAVAAALSGAFIFLVAHYADLRSEFIDAERQLNLPSHGQLASSQLGRAAFREAAAKALVASAATFVGAMLPVSVGAAAPSWRWSPLSVALGALALLGAFLARAVHGRPLSWVVALIIVGGILSWVGSYLHIA